MSDSQDIQKCCLPLLPKYQIKTNRLKGLKHFRLEQTDRKIIVSLKNADIESISCLGITELSWSTIVLVGKTTKTLSSSYFLTSEMTG